MDDMHGRALNGLRANTLSKLEVQRRLAERPAKPFNVVSTTGSLLVTGGTGFIGGAVLAELFKTKQWPKTLIMVRAANLGEARQRIEKSLLRFLPDEDVGEHLADDQIIVAGLEDAEVLLYDRRMHDVTHVIHSAAVTSFANHPRIKAINIDASLEFVAVLKLCANVQRFINVGTAWCIGMDVEKVVIEDGEQSSTEHIVPYTESKREFERHVRTTHHDFPFVSVRPSIVVGHSRLGTMPSGSIYWVFRAAQILGKYTCSFDEKVDVVPVDWVADALVRLTFKNELWFDTYHLSAGESAHSTVSELDTAIARGRNTPANGRGGYARVTSSQLKKAVYDRQAEFGDAHPILLARALSLYSRFADSGVLFDNSRTLSEGISPAPPFHSYAAECARTAEASSIAVQMEDDFK